MPHHATVGYEPGDVGHITFIGHTRVQYTIVRPGRSGWRVTTWRKLIPETFRNERFIRPYLAVHIPD